MPDLQCVWEEREHVDKHRIPVATWMKCNRLNKFDFSRIWAQLWPDQEAVKSDCVSKSHGFTAVKSSSQLIDLSDLQ